MLLIRARRKKITKRLSYPPCKQASRKMHSRTMKLSGIKEQSEHSMSDGSMSETDSIRQHSMEWSSSRPMPPPQISVKDEYGLYRTPPLALSEDNVSPILVGSFLRQLCVSSKKVEEDGDSVGLMTDKELETKFVNLSLAYKTDRDTVDQRVRVQMRARDLAEHNVNKELQGLGEAVEVMSHLVQDDDHVRDVLWRIKQHIVVIKQVAARVSSDAEVFGAVQQERRMCKAIEVMVMYTNNLRRPMPVCGLNVGDRQMRHCRKVPLPMVLGGSGSSSLTTTSYLDPKSQSASACTFIHNDITTTITKGLCSSFVATLLPDQFCSFTSPKNMSASRQISESKSSDNKGNTSRKADTDEDTLRQGCVEGLKAQLSTKLNTLRKQRNLERISESLEWDRDGQASQEDDVILIRSSSIENVHTLLSRAKEFVTKFKRRSNQKAIRNCTSVLLVLFAILIVFLSPPISTVDVKHFGKPPQ